jgi:hypothetical protein
VWTIPLKWSNCVLQTAAIKRHKGLARVRDDLLFLKQLLRDRTDIPAWLVPGRSVC